MKKKSNDFWIGVIGVASLLVLFTVIYGIGLFFEYFKYKAYIDYSHKDMSFWTYHLIKDHLRLPK